mmetsp:Transcript_36238/g.67388  ORF Transcript_36238/g.67388 Transcript_36238/m.67388 type:complete len:1026 (-) Transcript_36238:174-3251(-)
MKMGIITCLLASSALAGSGRRVLQGRPVEHQEAEAALDSQSFPGVSAAFLPSGPGTDLAQKVKPRRHPADASSIFSSSGAAALPLDKHRLPRRQMSPVRMATATETDVEEMKSRLIDAIKKCVVDNGGSAVFRQIRKAISIKLQVFMQSKLKIKHMKEMEWVLAEEFEEAGLKVDAEENAIALALEGEGEGFGDAIYVNLNVDRVRDARETLERTVAALPPAQDFDNTRLGNFLDASRKRNDFGRDELNKQVKSKEYQGMLESRQRLPIFAAAGDVIRTIRENQITLVLGATGCGKTTQVPQLIFEDTIMAGKECLVVATQPRRISASSVAQRVAAERGEELGDSVAYKVRFDDRIGENTRLVFCTVGILLKVLQSNRELEGATHIVIDEVHERDLHTDLMLTLVRSVIDKRPELKVVLMSATVDPSAFQDYFPSAKLVNIPGKTNFPIEELYLEHIFAANPSLTAGDDSKVGGRSRDGDKDTEDFEKLNVTTKVDEIGHKLKVTHSMATEIAKLHKRTADQLDYSLITNVVTWIHQSRGEGAVLVFVPGWQEIKETIKLLEKSKVAEQLQCLPLHSRIPGADQQAIFKRPPAGKRKVIVSTVLAETSITVEDVVFVVDCGCTKRTLFSESALIPALKTVWYAKSNGLQRRGRAGRCRPGAWFRLYTSLQWEAMMEYEEPEMLRSPLEETCLEVASLRLGPPAEFLAGSIAPPKPAVVDHAISLLYKLGAVKDATGEHLTPLGRKLSKLQVHPKLGKMLLLASLFRCFQPMMTICASLGYKSPFLCPMGKEKEASEAKEKLAGGSQSDHFAITEAFDGYCEEGFKFAKENLLSAETLSYIRHLRRDLQSAARDVVQAVPDDHPDELYKADVCRTVLVAGLYPNVAMVSKKDTAKVMGGLEAKVHPGSVNSNGAAENKLCVFFVIQETTSKWLYDTSVVEMLPLLLFAPFVHEKVRSKACVVFEVDDWDVAVNTAVADEVMQLRKLTAQFIEQSVGAVPTKLHMTATDTLAKLFSDHAPIDCKEAF